MSGWKTKLCGDNRWNFYGWNVAGLFIMVFSLWLAFKAIQAGATQSPTILLLLAIYFVLIGHFGLGLQNYCARVAEKLDSEKRKKDDPKNVS